MRTEVTFCHTSDTFVEYTVKHLTQTAILVGMYCCDLAIMITCNKQIFSAIIHAQVTTSHSINTHFVDQLQISIRFDFKHCHAFICDRIQILAVFRFYHIRRIVYRHYFSFTQGTFFHIHVIQMNSNTASMCISSNICNVFFFFHDVFSFLCKICVFFNIY